MIDQEFLILRGLKGGYRERIVYEKELYMQYSYFIGEGCRNHGLTYEDSFSAYSDTVLSAIHNIVSGKFDENAALKSYLFKIYFNKCVDLSRKITTNKERMHETSEIPELLTELNDGARSIVEKLIDAEKISAVKIQMEKMGKKCRQVLLLFEDGLTDKEITEELGYNNPTVVKSLRLRCVERLKEKVNNFLKAV